MKRGIFAIWMALLLLVCTVPQTAEAWSLREPNDKKAEAIVIDDAYYSASADVGCADVIDPIDYFKFSISPSTKITIQVSFRYPYANAVLYDENGIPVAVKPSDSTEFTFDDFLEAGTYYIKVEYKQSRMNRYSLTFSACIHAYHATTKVIEPTCAERGYTQYTCTVCGYQWKDNYVKEIGHELYSWLWRDVVYPTCTEPGTRVQECKTCGETVSDYVSSLGHYYGDSITLKRSSCSEEGLYLQICRLCGDASEATPRGEHTITEWVLIKAPTASENGYCHGYCANCDWYDYERLSLNTNQSKNNSWEIPKTITKIGERAFAGSSLKSVTIPVGVTEIGTGAFAGCRNLELIKIPDSVAVIGIGAFENCTSLTGVSIGTGITRIADNTFAGCNKLDRVYFHGNLPEISPTAFPEDNPYDPYDRISYRFYYTHGNASWENAVEELPYYCHGRCFRDCVTGSNMNWSCIKGGSSGYDYGDPLGTISESGWLYEYCQFNHSYQPATCNKPKTCTKCGGICGAPLGHQDNDGDYACEACEARVCEHIDAEEDTDHLCDLCGDSIGYHTYTYTVTEATCTEGGFYTFQCPCGHEYVGGNFSGFGHKKEWVPAVSPTCTQDGAEEALNCTVCGTVLEGGKSIPALGHSYGEAVVTPPSCTKDGYTSRTCKTCGDSTQEAETPALGHNFHKGQCTLCGEPDTGWTPPSRLAGGHRYETAFLAANRMKANLDIEKFDAVVVASGINFADALSGSYLAAVKNAPILLASGVDWVDALVKDYISANLNPGGTVYILGGTSAVPGAFETGLEAFVVNRLAGANRFDTNLMVLAEAGVDSKDILVCTGLGFADSLSASAAQLPILLVWNNLTDGQKELLDNLEGNKLYVIGGESAVSSGMEEQLKAYGEVARVAGGNRFETSVAIAETFFDGPESAVLAYAWNFPDGLCGGPLAATMDAPLILTMDKFEAKAADYIRSRNIDTGIILGGTGLISEETVNKIFN